VEDDIRNEFVPDAAVIFVSIVVNPDNTIGGNVYYNSVPLENLEQPQSGEASEILLTVKQILEESIKTQVEEEPSNLLSKKVVISLKTNLQLTQQEILSSMISEQTGLETSIVLNSPSEIVQQELRDVGLPILLDMRIDQEGQLSGNIYYNFEPLENLSGQNFVQARQILSIINQILKGEIEKVLASDKKEIDYSDTTITADYDSTTELLQEDFEEEATAEPEPSSNSVEEVNSASTDIELKNEFLLKEEDDEVVTVDILNDLEEGSGLPLHKVVRFDEGIETSTVHIEVFNHGGIGVTEVSGHVKSATPGVDFGTIKEIVSY